MNGKILILIIFVGLFCVPTFGDSYDDDEKIRRAAQQIADDEQRGRDDAKQRADDAERAKTPNDGSGGGVIFLIFGAVATGVWLHYRK